MTDKPDRFISIAEVAKMTGLRETTILSGECGSNELTSITLGRRTVFSFNAVEAWLLRQARKTLETRQWQEDAVREYLTRIGKARRRGGKKKIEHAIETSVNGEFEYDSEIEEAGQA